MFKRTLIWWIWKRDKTYLSLDISLKYTCMDRSSRFSYSEELYWKDLFMKSNQNDTNNTNFYTRECFLIVYHQKFVIEGCRTEENTIVYYKVHKWQVWKSIKTSTRSTCWYHFRIKMFFLSHITAQHVYIV